jgi:hypothetical protein|tara:strand:+ start:59 stop:481 length:423 start_codon:yes stop_codon:yes gene_type:complete
MIKYKLVCNKCKNTFDSWFASSKEFEKLKKKKFLSCITCNSNNVDKSLMAPLILKKSKKFNKKDEKNKNIKNKLKEYKNFIKNNFDYVGKNFAYEARIMHYDKKKSSKGIYGDASLDQINELKDEGIETEVIPWINDNEN